MNIGDKVSWSSQAQGSWKVKTGIVVDILPPNSYLSAKRSLKKKGIDDPPNSRVKFQMRSDLHRVLVEVPRGGKSTITDFYAPRSSQVKVIESTESPSEAAAE